MRAPQHLLFAVQAEAHKEEGHPINALGSTGWGTPKLVILCVFKNTAKLMREDMLAALTSPHKHGAGPSMVFF